MQIVKVKNHDLKIIQAILDANLISERYVQTVTDICLRQAISTLEKDEGYELTEEGKQNFIKEIREIIK